jgi:hypothetical protein
MGGGSDTTQTTQSQQTTQLPPWVNTAAQQNYALAQNTATRPLQQYQGQLVADPGAQMQQSWNTAAQGGNAGQQQYDASQAGYLGVMGQTPQQVTPRQLSTTNLQPYMNPYTSSVINATLPIMQQQLGLNQIGNQSQAAGAGAYGGSRQAIQQGVTQAQGAQGMAQMAAQLNQANFGQAQAAAGQDISTNLQGQLANQAAQQNQAGLNLQGAQGLANLGQQAQLSQARNFTEQMTAGTAEQQQAQNQINAQAAKFQQAWQYPYQQLGVLQSALGMTPYGTAQQGQTTTQTQAAANPLGMAMGGLGALGDLFSGGANSAMSGLAGLFGSDRRMKTDIAKIGVHPSGVPLYSFRYKGDPKSYPKVVGPMAEDVAKIAPGAVAPIPGSGGKMAIHPAFTGALGAPGAMPTPAPGLPSGAPPTAGRPPGVRLPAPNLTAIAGGGPAVGALAAPSPMGAIGARGGSMKRPPQPRRIMRPPPLRGALGG